MPLTACSPHLSQVRWLAPPIQAADPSTQGPGSRVLRGRLCPPHPRRSPQASRASSRWVSRGGGGILLWSRPLRLATRPTTCGAGLALAMGPHHLPITAWTVAKRPGEQSGLGFCCSWGTAGVGRWGVGTRGSSSRTDQLLDPLDAWEARMEPWHPLLTPMGLAGFGDHPGRQGCSRPSCLTAAPLALSEIVRTRGPGVVGQGGPGVHWMAPSAARVSWTLNQPTVLASGSLGPSAWAGGL